LNNNGTAGARRVVVIGAGHNGLVAATYLARSGLTVTVVEATDTVGGVCQTAEVLPGFRGNLASNTPHNFDPAVIADLELESFGLEWIYIDTASAMVLLPEHERIISFADPAARRAELEKFHPGEADAYAATLREMNELGRTLDVSFYDPPPHFSELLGKLQPGRQEDFFARIMFGTATDIAQERLRSEQVRSSLAMLAVTGNFMGPSTPGSAYQLIQRPLYRESSAARSRQKVQLTADYATKTPRGGMGALTASIGRAAEAAGVAIVREAKVAQITTRHGAASGVLLSDGREIPADVVLSAANPQLTMTEMVPPELLDDALLSTLRQQDMEGCMGKVYIGMEGTPQFAAARSQDENEIMFRCGMRAGSTIEEMDCAYERARHGDWSGKPIIYGLTQTSFDDSLTPPNRHLMSLSVSYAPRTLRHGTWSEQKKSWAKHVIDALTNHIPNLPDIMVDYDALSPEDLEIRFGMTAGNALHGDVSAARMFNWRPFSGYSDYTTPVPGLYLGSAGTWPANYVSGLSGRNAAFKVLQDLSG
jgi:phytoene dehydrogenase-like protein